MMIELINKDCEIGNQLIDINGKLWVISLKFYHLIIHIS